MEEKTPQSSINNLDENVSAAFAYLIPPFTGIVFFLLEKESRFVKYHSLQSIFLGMALFILKWFTEMAKFVFIGYYLESFVNMAVFALALFCMYKAYKKEEFELPYLGKLAKQNLDRI